jgi:hypothetical protein
MGECGFRVDDDTTVDRGISIPVWDSANSLFDLGGELRKLRSCICHFRARNKAIHRLVNAVKRMYY